jgi:hypothetical protein
VKRLVKFVGVMRPAVDGTMEQTELSSFSSNETAVSEPALDEVDRSFEEQPLGETLVAES